VPDKLNPNVYVFELELMEEGVALDRVAVPPERVNVKSLASNAPLPPDVLYTASLNVTAMLALLEATVVPVIAGAVVSITIVLEPDDDQLPAASRSWT
jgi:hypothetical protein